MKLFGALGRAGRHLGKEARAVVWPRGWVTGLIIVVTLILRPAIPHAQGLTFSYTHSETPGIMEFNLLYVDGEFDPGSADRFEQYVIANKVPAGTTVLLNSPGGSVFEALEMGRFIRARGFETNVSERANRPPDSCYSACTLAFLGGVRRTKLSAAQFGVHRVSTTTSLAPADALDLGQITIGQISEYVAYMGVKPGFVEELTSTPSSKINLLNNERLEELGVLSPLFKTTWELKINNPNKAFYVLSTTETNNGRHKMIFACEPGKQPIIMMLYNVNGPYQPTVLSSTSYYFLAVDNTDIELRNDEILDRVSKTGPNYVGVTIKLSPRILSSLRNAAVLGFKMFPPSRMIYAGWDSDFASGREKVFDYLRTCK